MLDDELRSCYLLKQVFYTGTLFDCYNLPRASVTVYSFSLFFTRTSFKSECVSADWTSPCVCMLILKAKQLQTSYATAT